MPNRVLKESINESRSLSEASFFAEDLYKRLITYADDYGRFNADYQIMRARLYPREIQIVSDSDIEDALIELSGAGKIAFYTSKARNEIYGCFPNWHKHQRIRESKTKCPDIDDTTVNDWYLRRFIPINLKKEIINRDNFKCKICGKYVASVEDATVLIKMGAGLYHIDHIVPVNQGGRATAENLQLTCPKCNLSRSRHFTVEEIIEMTQNECFAEGCGELPQVAKKICLNPIQSNPNPNPNRNPNQNAREMNVSEGVERFLEAYTLPVSQINRYRVEIEFCDCLLNKNVIGEHLIEAAKNYADKLKRQEKAEDYQFIKKPENFLRDMEYCQYLPGVYEPPKPVKKGWDANKGLMRRDYGDWSELEKELVANY